MNISKNYQMKNLLSVLAALLLSFSAIAVCPITKTNGGGFTTTINSVVKNCNGTYTIQLLVIHDGCSGPSCKTLSQIAIQAASGTYSSCSKQVIAGSMTGGTLSMGPNLGASVPFQGFKFDNTGNIGDGKAGTVKITYTLTYLQDQQIETKAGTSLQIAQFYVSDFTSVMNCNGTGNPLPVLAAISGSSSVCAGSTTTLSDATTGGTWSSNNTGVATINSSGVVTGVSVGTATISYSKTNSCGTSSVTKSITVNTASPVAAITGASALCVGSSIPLSDATSGGTWSSNNTSVATVNSAGVVTGVSTGAATISYAVTNACGTTTVTKGLTINTTTPVSAILGASSVYAGRNITLTDETGGGTWSSSNTAIATVTAAGLVTGVATGSATISYSVVNSCGTTSVTKNITVIYLDPLAVNDTTSTAHATPVIIDPLSNDVAGSKPFVTSTLTFIGSIPSTSTVGSFVINNDGTVTFTPVSSFSGVTVIQYRISDQQNHSTTAYIVVRVAAPLIVDTDNDGAPDGIDEYPTDPNRAFNHYYPAHGFSTLMYEDLWPNVGDYDFNDLVVDFKYRTVTNASNNVVEVKYVFVTKCFGAALHNGFAFQLDNIAPNKISAVRGPKTHNAPWLSNASNGTENGQTYANVVVFDDVYKVMPFPGTGHFVNTYLDAPYVMPDTTCVVITFIDNGVLPSGGALAYSSLPTSAFNPYLVCGDSGTYDQNRSKEIHLANRVPSSKMANTWWGTRDDNSNPGMGRYFRDANNRPWGLEITSQIPYMQEKVDFASGYLKFLDWAASSGTTNTDWYLDLSGYRDASKLYIR